MNAVSIAVALAYLLAAARVVVALHLMNLPGHRAPGQPRPGWGMIVAVAAALVSVIHDADDQRRPGFSGPRRRAAGGAALG